MRQLTIIVPENQLRRIQQLLRQEPGVTVGRSKPLEAPSAPSAPPAKKKLTRKQQEWVDDLKQALVDVERHQRGELEMVSLDAYLTGLGVEVPGT